MYQMNDKGDPTTWEEAATRCVQVIRHAATVDTAVPFEPLYDQMRWIELAAAAWQEMTERDRVLDGSEVVNILAKKQRDYGPRNILRFGTAGLKVRLWDKIARYENLTDNRNGDASNEPLEDTLLDIIGYVTIWMMLNEGWFELELGKDYS